MNKETASRYVGSGSLVGRSAHYARDKTVAPSDRAIGDIGETVGLLRVLLVCLISV